MHVHPPRVASAGELTLGPTQRPASYQLMSTNTSPAEMQVHLTDPQAALDELYRELQVRKRCFPRWVEDGRISRTDAQDRLNRMHTAHELLKAAMEKEEVAT